MAKNKITEHDALREIDGLLTPLSDDQKQWVFDCIALKHKIAPPKISGTGNASQGSNPASIGAESTLKSFLAAKKPSGFDERIACICYYLEKSTASEHITTKDITMANTDAKQSKIPNPSLYVNRAARKGFINTVGSRNKAISVRGEALVEALPDRENVKTALEEHPFRRNSKKKKKKKTKAKAKS